MSATSAISINEPKDYNASIEQIRAYIMGLCDAKFQALPATEKEAKEEVNNLKEFMESRFDTSPYAKHSGYRTCSAIDIPEAPSKQKRVTMKSRNGRRDFVIADLWTAMGYAISAYAYIPGCEYQEDRVNMTDVLTANLTKWCYTVAKVFKDRSRDTGVFPSTICVVWLRMNPQAHYTPAIFFNGPNPVSLLPSRLKHAKDMIQDIRKKEMQKYLGPTRALKLPKGIEMDFGYCAENPALMYLLPTNIASIHVESLAVETAAFGLPTYNLTRPRGTHKAACPTCISFADLLVNHAKDQKVSSVFEFKDLLPARVALDCPFHLLVRGVVTCDDCATLYCTDDCRENDKQRCIREANRGYATPTPSPPKKGRSV